MDTFTHFLVPYAAALLVLGMPGRPGSAEDAARRDGRVALAVVFGAAGLAPDLDGAYSWVKHAPGLWWLQHRGASHSLLGAPFHAALVVLGLHALARWRPARFGRFCFRPAFVPVAMVGSWTHLVLDGVTYGGVPAFFPFGDGRVALPVFHWLVFWMFPLGAVVIGFHLAGRLGPRGTARAGVAFVLILLVVAGVRLHYRPDEGEGVWVFPRAAMTEWTVVADGESDARPPGYPREPGYYAWLARGGTRHGEPVFFREAVEPGAHGALGRARHTDAFRGFELGAFGPVAVTTEREPEGGWVIHFTAVAQRFEALHAPAWTPTRGDAADWGYVAFRVTSDVETLHAGW